MSEPKCKTCIHNGHHYDVCINCNGENLYNYKSILFTEKAKNIGLNINQKKHKIEIWIDKYDKSFCFYIQDTSNKDDYNIFDIPSMWIEDELQVDIFKEMFKYLGYEIPVKYVESED